MTLLEIQNALRAAGITLSPRQIHRDIRRLRARPAGIFRTRPQTWPADLPARIAAARGAAPARLYSLRELRDRVDGPSPLARQIQRKGNGK